MFWFLYHVWIDEQMDNGLWDALGGLVDIISLLLMGQGILWVTQAV